MLDGVCHFYHNLVQCDGFYVWFVGVLYLLMYCIGASKRDLGICMF
jgi:hypothetical protein